MFSRETHRTVQTAEELHYLKAFLKCAHFPAGTPKALLPPRPDFRIRIDGVAIGVELTEYHLVSGSDSRPSRRAIEHEWQSLRSQIMQRVEQERSLIRVHATLHFKSFLPSRGDHAVFIEQLIACVRANPVGISTILRNLNDYSILSIYLKSIRVKPVRCAISWDWNGNSAWIGVDPDSFVKCVQRKIAKTYDRTGLQEFWLLIVSGTHLSQAMGVRVGEALASLTQVDELLGRSTFQKVFVFQYMCDIAHEWPGWKTIRRQETKSPTRGCCLS